MKLWILEWPDAFPDEVNVLVIRSETKEQAIELAKKENFYYHETLTYHRSMFDHSKWTIKELTIEGPEEIVVSE